MVRLGNGVCVGSWRAVGLGLDVGIGVDVEGVDIVGRTTVGGTAVAVVGIGAGETSMLGTRPATTWTVIWSLLEAALSALIVTLFVQVPSAVARKTR
jgi:hypothetical protein